MDDDSARSDEALVLAAVRRALVGAAGDLSFDAVLQQLVDAALQLVGARYAALGVPDDRGGFSRFITAGMEDELVEQLGPLPRTHGMLGAMLTSPDPYRTVDIRDDPRFTGWWPAKHPQMRSFLGYPIVFKGDIVAAFYLTDKVGAESFSLRDEQLVGAFAPHAAVLVEMARLYAQSRELSVAEERARIARELHDSLTQSLFGTKLSLRTATATLQTERQSGGGAEAAAVDETLGQLNKAAGVLDGAFDELRALVWDLQPPDLELDHLTGAVRKQLALVERTSGLQVDLWAEPEADELGSEDEHQVLRILQEAVTNVVRHSEATTLAVTMAAAAADRGDGGDLGDTRRSLVVEVRDDGAGFDPELPAIRSRRLGLTSMHERAETLGGRLTIDAAPGKGTVVRLEVPLDR